MRKISEWKKYFRWQIAILMRTGILYWLHFYGAFFACQSFFFLFHENCISQLASILATLPCGSFFFALVDFDGAFRCFFFCCCFITIHMHVSVFFTHRRLLDILAFQLCSHRMSFTKNVYTHTHIAVNSVYRGSFKIVYVFALAKCRNAEKLMLLFGLYDVRFHFYDVQFALDSHFMFV